MYAVRRHIVRSESGGPDTGPRASKEGAGQPKETTVHWQVKKERERERGMGTRMRGKVNARKGRGKRHDELYLVTAGV